MVQMSVFHWLVKTLLFLASQHFKARTQSQLEIKKWHGLVLMTLQHQVLPPYQFIMLLMNLRKFELGSIRN